MKKGVFFLLFALCCITVNAQKKKNKTDTFYLSKYGLLTSSIYDDVIANNNTIKFNKTLKEFGGNKRVFILPKGIIWVNSSIHIPSNTSLTGNKSGVSFIAMSPIFINSEEGVLENEHYNLGSTASDSFINVSNLTISGNGVQPLKGQPRGIFFNKVKNIIIKNISVFNTVLEGIRIDCSYPNTTSKNILIEKCRIERRGFTLPDIMFRSITDDPFNSTNVQPQISKGIVRNNITIGGNHGIAIFNSKYISVTGNRCIANTHRGIIISPGGEDILISKNKVDSAGSTGIHLAFNVKNIRIENNYVSNTVADMSGLGQEGQGIKAYAGFTNVIIVKNTCINNATDGIALEGGAEGVGFFIRNNICNNNKRNGIRICAGGIHLKKPADLSKGLIENNHIKNNIEEAIFVGSDNGGLSRVKNLVVQNNIILNKSGKKKFKIEFTDNSIKVK